MNKKIAYGGIGLVLGAILLQSAGGAIAGLVIGLMLGQLEILSQRLAALEGQQRGAQEQARRPEAEQAGSQASTATTPAPDSVAARPPPAHSTSHQAIQRQVQTARPVESAPRTGTAREGLPLTVGKAFALLRRFFTEGNPIVRVGVVVLFFGLSFMVKYASSAGLLPIELRLAVIATVAIALILLGWKTRERSGGYGLVLQGGGIAALYLTIFAACKFYSLMPMLAAFGLMFLVVMLGAALALLQNAQVLALMATAGGFLAPILTSDGSGNHLGLFGFYLLLNLGLLAISWFKAWRLLNWVGFVFTFVITATWGVLSYRPEFYASTQPFLAAFFALYLIVSILFSIRQPPRLKGLVDGSLVFGLPVVAFGLQAQLLAHSDYGLAISSVVLAAIYIALASFLWTRFRDSHRLLSECFIALGVVFATLAVPLALEADWTSATWAIEAAGLLWIGLKQHRRLPRLAAYLLYAAAIVFLVEDGLSAGTVPIVTGDFIGLVIVSLAAFAMALLLERNLARLQRLESGMEALMLIVAFAWWYIAGISELSAHLSDRVIFAPVLAFLSLSAAAVVGISRLLNWQSLGAGAYSLLPLAMLWSTGNLLLWLFAGAESNPLAGWATPAVLLFALVHFGVLYARRSASRRSLLNSWHVLGAWLLIMFWWWEVLWWNEHYALAETASFVLWFAAIATPLVLIAALRSRLPWPLQSHDRAWRVVVPAPVLLMLLLWFVLACFAAGATAYSHLPLLSPLDLAQLAFVVLLGWLFRYNMADLGQHGAALRNGILLVCAFIWLNVVVLRGVHHFGGVIYRADALWNDASVQMALSILWTLCSLLVMNLSRRLQSRRLWLLGAALLVLVLIKLFTKDLTGSGTMARIVSFMAVGGLMLLIGYLSPIPAAKTEASVEEGIAS